MPTIYRRTTMFQKVLLAIILTTVCLLPLSHIFSQEDKESFYSQLGRAVIRLEHYEDVKKEGQDRSTRETKWDGTGFFVKTREDLYVVTARHVVETGYDLHARVPVSIAGGRTEVMELRLPRTQWVFHSNGASPTTHAVDVAVMKIPQNNRGGVVVIRYCPGECPKDEYNQLELDPVPPQQIMVFGYPLDIGFQLSQPRPMGRQGIVAFQAEEEFIKYSLKGVVKYAEENAFLVDAKLFPGNSGSPILRVPILGRKVYLVGLVVASNERLDFAIAEPSSRIRETLDLAQNSTEDFQAWFPLE